MAEPIPPVDVYRAIIRKIQEATELLDLCRRSVIASPSWAYTPDGLAFYWFLVGVRDDLETWRQEIGGPPP